MASPIGNNLSHSDAVSNADISQRTPSTNGSNSTDSKVLAFIQSVGQVIMAALGAIVNYCLYPPDYIREEQGETRIQEKVQVSQEEVHNTLSRDLEEAQSASNEKKEFTLKSREMHFQGHSKILHSSRTVVMSSREYLTGKSVQKANESTVNIISSARGTALKLDQLSATIKLKPGSSLNSPQGFKQVMASANAAYGRRRKATGAFGKMQLPAAQINKKAAPAATPQKTSTDIPTNAAIRKGTGSFTTGSNDDLGIRSRNGIIPGINDGDY